MRKQIESIKKGFTHNFFYPAILLVAGLAVSVNCNGQEKHRSTEQNFSQSSVELIKLKKEVEAANSNLTQALMRGDMTTVADCFAEDAKFMAPNKPTLVSKKAIQAGFSGMANSGVTNLQLTTIDVWGNNSLLTEEGLYTLATKTGQQLDKGKYIVLWKKEQGGWKIFRECYNSELPATPAN